MIVFMISLILSGNQQVNVELEKKNVKLVCPLSRIAEEGFATTRRHYGEPYEIIESSSSFQNAGDKSAFLEFLGCGREKK